jgi:ATP-dependent protease ClpP protease subunit
MNKFLNGILSTIGATALILSIAVACAPKSDYGVSGAKSVQSTSPDPQASSTPPGKSKTVAVVKTDPNRTVYLVGEVSSNALQIAETITRLGQESKDPIYLVETSPGGSVLLGGQIIAAMESSPAPVYTVCHVICASMAAMIFEYGTKRYVGDRSFLMFHPAAGSAEGELDKMVSRLLSMQRYIGKMEAFTGNRANLTFEQYKAKAAVEGWIDGEDAVYNQFADQIATVVLPKNSPFSGELGARALYDALFTQTTYTTISAGDFNWRVSPKDLQWLNHF